MKGKAHGDFFDLVGTFDPRVIPTAAKKGTYFRYVPSIGNPTTLMKADDGLSTNWVEAAGGSGVNWTLTGNNGAGHILGTLSNDRWTFVSNNLERGGFENDGRFFLKTHQSYPDTESYFQTNGVETFDDTPTTLFSISVPENHIGYVDVFVAGRESGGAERAVFKRQAMFWREGLGVQISPKVHTMFTDKTNINYNVQVNAIGNDVVIQVIGAISNDVVWTGLLNHQLLGGV